MNFTLEDVERLARLAVDNEIHERALRRGALRRGEAYLVLLVELREGLHTNCFFMKMKWMQDGSLYYENCPGTEANLELPHE